MTALARGELLAGRFEIVAVIGRGGMGIVYHAHDRVLDEPVAMKVSCGATSCRTPSSWPSGSGRS